MHYFSLLHSGWDLPFFQLYTLWIILFILVILFHRRTVSSTKCFKFVMFLPHILIPISSISESLITVCVFRLNRRDTKCIPVRNTFSKEFLVMSYPYNFLSTSSVSVSDVSSLSFLAAFLCFKWGWGCGFLYLVVHSFRFPFDISSVILGHSRPFAFCPFTYTFNLISFFSHCILSDCLLSLPDFYGWHKV